MPGEQYDFPTAVHTFRLHPTPTDDMVTKAVAAGQVGRAYSRVCRRKLRSHLLQQCQQHGVHFMDAAVSNIEIGQGSQSLSTVELAGGKKLQAR